MSTIKAQSHDIPDARRNEIALVCSKGGSCTIFDDTKS